MYYIWDRDTSKGNKQLNCKLRDFPGIDDLIDSKRIEVPKAPLVYDAEVSDLIPDDYPWCGGLFYLVSEKIAKILIKKKQNIQYIPSIIDDRNGTVYNNYYTLNILSIIHCMDFEKSEYTVSETIPGYPRYHIDKLALDKSKLNKNDQIFWLGEEKAWLVLHSDIVELFQKNGVKGVRYIASEDSKLYCTSM